MKTGFVIGNDIGGSHITCIAVDPLNHMIIKELRVRNDVDCHGSSDEILGAWTDALAELIKMGGKENLGGIGFAMPGPFDYPAGLAQFRGVQKFDSLYGINVRDELSRRLALDRDIPVRFLNDATCFAIGEAWLGKASAYQRMMAITLGTGFGSAFLKDGIPVESGYEVPESGCVYYLPFGDSNADDHFSTRWFIKRYKTLTGKDIQGVKEIVEEAKTSPVARSIFTEFGNNLGNFLSPWLNRFHAGCLTIGGNIANSYSLFETPFKSALANNTCYTEVLISELGEYAAIAGSARLCDDSFYSKLPFISNK
ncbi:MAG: ROK family protein [Bacteroidia bacterium]|nr:ROK family protein [Bacteroidia bacterium]